MVCKCIDNNISYSDSEMCKKTCLHLQPKPNLINQHRLTQRRIFFCQAQDTIKPLRPLPCIVTAASCSDNANIQPQLINLGIQVSTHTQIFNKEPPGKVICFFP
ncbi:hypothetical protein CRENBAI_023743 [Crenichthys baileyi]|uniref:Uncharacterized protein n=1 Tax=Crenichthys baileyi TaxID=28760 RepID=A0AAV9SRJ3_9TELE